MFRMFVYFWKTWFVQLDYTVNTVCVHVVHGWRLKSSFLCVLVLIQTRWDLQPHVTSADDVSFNAELSDLVKTNV